MIPATGPDQILAPDVPLTPFVFQRAHLLKEQLALVDGVTGHALSYAQLTGATRLVAASLARLGFGRGDACAILAPNLPEYAVAVYAAAVLGGAAWLIDPNEEPSRLARMLSSARVVVAAPEALASVVAATGAWPGGRVFVLGEAGATTASFTELYKSTGYLPEVRVDCQTDIVVACGTATFTHRAMLEAICWLEAAQPIAPGQVVVSTVPFWCAYGATAMLGLAVSRGATIVSLPRACGPDVLVTMVERYRATRAYVELPLLRALATAQPSWSARVSLDLVVGLDAGWDELVTRQCAERLGWAVRPATPIAPPETDAAPVSM